MVPPVDTDSLLKQRRAAHAQRVAVAADRWSRFQAASRQRYGAQPRRSILLSKGPFGRGSRLARAKTPGRILLLKASKLWDHGLGESLGSTPGPAASLYAYVAAGPDPGVQPRALFDQAWYLQRAPGLTGSRWPPLAHYVVLGDSHNLSPHPLLDAPAYRARRGAQMAARQFTALEDFLFGGAAEGADPHPLFDVRYYVGQSEAVAASGENPLIHYLRIGWREGLEPHPLFAGSWYLEQNPDAAESGVAPLLHYVLTGAAQGRDPHPLFDAAGYVRQSRGGARDDNPLVDFLRHGARELKSPNPHFNVEAYLEQTRGSPQARANPLLHYLTTGAHEGLWPAPDFDEAGYLLAHPEAVALPVSALEHWVTARTDRVAGVGVGGHTISASTLFEALRTATDPEPEAYGNAAYFALRRPRPADRPRADARVIALRRDAAPDWLAVSRALPSYRGHLQPRLPADGFADPGACLARDVALAQRYGLYGFCHEVADAGAAARARAADFPFCLAWTGDRDPVRALAEMAPALAAPQMIRIDGRPVVLLESSADAAAWRAAAETFGGLFLLGRGRQPRPGFDGWLAEPPSRAPEGAPGVVFNPDFRGMVHKAGAQAAEQIARPVGEDQFPLVIAARDTTPLAQDAPTVWHGACPGMLQARLEAAADDIRDRSPERRLIFVHAWNDWETGAALAPDLKFGHGWLEAVANAADADLLGPG